MPDDEPRVVERIIALATAYGRDGYRRITGLWRGEGWPVNHKRVERRWRREGLKVPKKQPNRGRLWLTDGSCVRCRPAYRLHVWAYDLLTARTPEVLETLAELFVTHGVPAQGLPAQSLRVL